MVITSSSLMQWYIVLEEVDRISVYPAFEDFLETIYLYSVLTYLHLLLFLYIHQTYKADDI